MIRKIRILGLMIGVPLAVSAMGASSASAASFHIATVPATVSGTQSTGHVFTTSAGNMTCTTVVMAEQVLEKTPTQLTLSPSYMGCTAFGAVNVPVDMNGCDFLFKATGEWRINCPAGASIEITKPGCTTKIVEQGLVGMTYTNNGAKTDFKATTNSEGIVYNECGAVRNNGRYTGSTTVNATSAIWFE